MTDPTSNRTRSIWKETRPLVAAARLHTRPVEPRPSKPAAKTQAEKEADRWIAEMMFDHYNG